MEHFLKLLLANHVLIQDLIKKIVEIYIYIKEVQKCFKI